MKPSSLARGYAIALTAAFFGSTTGIFAYLSTRYQMPPLTLAFWRDLFVAMGLWAGLRLFKPHGLGLPEGRRRFFFIGLYGLILAAFNAAWTISVALNGAAIATVLVYCSPAFTALIGWRAFGEKLDAPKVIAVGLSIAGCALVAGVLDSAMWRVNPLGIGVGLLGGVMFAVYSLFGKAASQRGLEPWTTMLYTFALAARLQPAGEFWPCWQSARRLPAMDCTWSA
jgi:drug/metabolite transporter (DMT)-like permease